MPLIRIKPKKIEKIEARIKETRGKKILLRYLTNIIILSSVPPLGISVVSLYN